MPFHIRNRETEKLTRKLARTARMGLTEAVHMAVANELERRQQAVPLWERTADLRARVRARVKDSRPVDKAFRDSLYEEKASDVR
jgi:antitoxin VapB